MTDADQQAMWDEFDKLSDDEKEAWCRSRGVAIVRRDDGLCDVVLLTAEERAWIRLEEKDAARKAAREALGSSR